MKLFTKEIKNSRTETLERVFSNLMAILGHFEADDYDDGTHLRNTVTAKAIEELAIEIGRELRERAGTDSMDLLTNLTKEMCEVEGLEYIEETEA